MRDDGTGDRVFFEELQVEKVDYQTLLFRQIDRINQIPSSFPSFFRSNVNVDPEEYVKLVYLLQAEMYYHAVKQLIANVPMLDEEIKEKIEEIDRELEDLDGDVLERARGFFKQGRRLFSLVIQDLTKKNLLVKYRISAVLE
jgi:hypothetical protein